jgi:hypothetical protein
MAAPGVEQVGERPLEELVQNASQQAVALAREQLDVARQELLARARRAAPGLGLIGGGAFLLALASGTGSASLILLLSRRPGASAAALGVTAAYAGAGAFLAREGLVRVQDAASPGATVEDEPAKSAKGNAQSPTQPARSAAKTARQSVKSQTKSRPQPGRGKLDAKSATPRRGAPRAQAERRRRS